MILGVRNTTYSSPSHPQELEQTGGQLSKGDGKDLNSMRLLLHAMTRSPALPSLLLHLVVLATAASTRRRGCGEAVAAFGAARSLPRRSSRRQPSVRLKGCNSVSLLSAAAKSDVIDAEGAMTAFFSSREEWLPLFRSVAGSDLPADTASLLDSLTAASGGGSGRNTEVDLSETNSPWQRLEAIPQDEENRAVVAKFLDAMQDSLLAIPVNEVPDPETAVDDENDKLFVEEGRRLLAIGRFHVLRGNQGGTVESVDALFAHCWSEVLELSRAGTAHSGSLILLPSYELSDLRRFADMNVVQPLQWLGVHADFEVVSLQRDSPAIRLIYKLSDVPAGAYTEEEGFAASEE